MSPFLQPVVHLSNLRIVIPLAWLALFLSLAGATGWRLSDFLFSNPGLIHAALLAVALPMLLALVILIHEAGHQIFRSCEATRAAQYTLHICGLIPSGYVPPGLVGRELLSAASGILVSAASGLLLMLVAKVLPVGSDLIFWLGAGSMLFAALNLLPAFPFDGGRILQSVFWFLNDAHLSGTRVAFVYSQLVATCLLAFGIFVLAFHERYLIAGLWMVALGWLAIRAARAEHLRANLIERAGRASAADAILGLNPTIRARANISEAVDILLEQRNNGPGLVRDRDRFVGVVTLNRTNQVPRVEWNERTVSEIMDDICQLPDTPPGATLLDVLLEQSRRPGISVVVRAANGEIVGLIDETIAPRLLLRRAEERSFAVPAGKRSGDSRSSP